MLNNVFGKFGSLGETFWFIPSLMSLGAVALSLLTLGLDESVEWEGFGQGPLSIAGSADGARTVLATIAGSMITVASLTFSITIASLSLASSQYGPRLVRNFVRDRGNQMVLGTFIATFLYCLLVLRTVRGTDAVTFVPSISLTVGVALATASIGVLIYFINHVALSIQATRIIATIGSDLTNSIDRLYPERLSGEDTEETESAEDDDAWEPDGEGRLVYASRSGYLQLLSYDDLVGVAERADVVLRIPHHPGQFIAKGSSIAEVFGGSATADREELDKEVRDGFTLGGERAAGRDIEYFIDQLVEIAVRALSPGINDPFTAMESLDQLGASLRQLAERRLPSGHHRDERGDIRVVAKAQTLEGALDAAFNLIRQYGASSVPVMLRLMETIAVLAEYASLPEHKQALLSHARLVERAAKAELQESVDTEALESRFQTVIEALESHQAPPPEAP